MPIIVKSLATFLIYFILYMLLLSPPVSAEYNLLVVFIYIPIFLLVFWLPIYTIIPLLLGLALLSYVNIWSGFLVSTVVLFPIMLTYLLEKTNRLYFKNLYIYSIYYFITLISCVILYAIYYIPNLPDDIHNYFYETLSFMMLYLNGSTNNTFSEIKNLDQKIELLSFIIPTLLTYCFLLWFLLNYKIIKFSHIIKENLTFSNYLPKFHTILFIIFAICTIILHKLLAKHTNLNYIFYNIVFVLWLAYYYSGIIYIWQRISNYKSFLLNFLFITLLVFLFFETIIIVCLVGFIIEVNNLFVLRKSQNIQ
ncbi:hypothetical protein HPDP_00482 [Candidatus Hepatincola sp. Pdp]